MVDSATTASQYERERRRVAFFSDAEEVLVATRRLTGAGFAVGEIYGPHPLHELDEILGRGRSRLPWITLLAGAFGGLAALALQFYTAVIDWPINVGGKPANSTLAFIPITFELTVLLGGLATAGAFLAVSRLIPRLRPPGLLPGVTYDRFALVIESASSDDDREVCGILEQAGADEIRTMSEETTP